MRQSSQPRVPALAVAAVVAGAAVIGIVRGDGDPGSPGAREYGVAALLGVATFAVVLVIARRIARAPRQVPEIAERLAADDDQQLLLTRWMQRARRARFVGGAAGIIAWLLAMRADGSPWVWGFGGIAVGALAAELHHLRRPTGPRTARLDVRSVPDYLWPLTGWHMVGSAAAGALNAALGVAFDERDAIGCGAGAVATIAVAHLAQRRVASRARPALPDRLRAADDLARELAIDRNIGWPSAYTALSLVSVGALSLTDHLVAVAVVGVFVQFYAIGLWWRNRRLGLDWLLHERRGPVLA